MTHFPVSNSTLSSSHLALFLQGKYQLSQDACCKLLKTGINHSYLVVDGDNRYVFRIYSLGWRAELEILEEIRLLNLLKENDISISYPIADSSGGYIHVLGAPEGDRFGVMFSFARGEKILNYSPEIHCRVGETMARIHSITEGLVLDRVEYDTKVLMEDSVEKIKLFLNNSSEEMIFLEALKNYLVIQYEKVAVGEVRRGAVHLDMWFDNMHFFEKCEITIFDFDFCGNGWLCHDIAYYIMQLYNTEKDEVQYKLKLESFLSGYESVVKISEEEKRIIPFLSLGVFIFYLGVQCQRFDNWSNIFLNEIYLKRFIYLIIKKWYDYHQLPTL